MKKLSAVIGLAAMLLPVAAEAQERKIYYPPYTAPTPVAKPDKRPAQQLIYRGKDGAPIRPDALPPERVDKTLPVSPGCGRRNAVC